MPSYVMAHDLGTSADKAVLYDGDGAMRAAATAAYGTDIPAAGHVEQDPRDWWRAVSSTSREVLERAGVAAGDVAAVSFSGQMMGCVAVDEDGDALRPAIIWADRRATNQADAVARDVGAWPVYEITGHRPSESYSAAKCAWIKEHEPDVYRRTRAFLQAKDYVVRQATGRWMTDPSDASGTNLYDLRAGDWSAELVSAWGLDGDRLPELVASDAVAGVLTPSAAERLGLLAGTPVAAGGGDGACAAVGAGAVTPEVAYASLGSSSWIGLYAEEVVLDPEMRTFTWAHLVPGAFAPTGTMQTAGLSHAWASGVLAGPDGEAIELDEAAAAAPAGADGLLFLPYLLGERCPHWNPRVRGAFIGLTLEHSTSQMARAVQEGVALNLRTILECFAAVGHRPERIRLVGGGARSAVAAQVLTDVLGVETVVADAAESGAALGAAVAGGLAVGLYDGWHIVDAALGAERMFVPDERNGVLYAQAHHLFTEAYRRLEPVLEGLGELGREDMHERV